MDENVIRESLAALGRHLSPGPIVELTIVGGSAGVLTGELPGTVTTGDVDVMTLLPPTDLDRVQDAAADVTKELRLPANWLNTDAGLYREGLPPGWEFRRIDVGHFDSLHVWSIGRLDLIVMKFYAHRPHDLEHLTLLNVTDDEKQKAKILLDQLESQSVVDEGKIQMARNVIEHWK
jgi:hypothetical protein